MADTSPRLCVLTGIPGSGKTTVALKLQPRLPPGWTLLRGDDFIGVTQACYPGKPWQEVRRFLPYFAGWAAGWYLAMERGVLLEGHFRDREELDRLVRGVRDIFRASPRPMVVGLEGDPAEIARRLTENEQREPKMQGPDREKNFAAWLEISKIEPSICDRVIDARGHSEEEVARRVADVFELSWNSTA